MVRTHFQFASLLVLIMITKSVSWRSIHSASPLFSRRVALLSTTTTTPSSNPSVLASRLDGLDKPTVWHEFSPLAVEHGAINLGQGFPDWDPPNFVQNAMNVAVHPSAGRNANQYARSYAHLPLARVLAAEYARKFHCDINPETQVATAVGCTNALYCAMQGLLNPGDQAILLEPAFDVYYSQVRMAGGEPIFVPLRPTGNVEDGASRYFQLDFTELERAITPRTRVIIVNSPHNPTGKMFSEHELRTIADIVKKHPKITVIADEVYEHILYDPKNEPHVHMGSILFDQTLTLSSSGKTFSCTGWKVGWAVGPPHLVKAVTAVQQWVNFSAPTPNQDAIAQALVQAREPYQGYNTFYDYLADDYKKKRQILMDALQTAGMTPVLPAGGFFIMADTSRIDFPLAEMQATVKTPAMPADPMPRDWALSRWLTEHVGVTAIPPSSFMSPDTIPLASNLLRFAFCKNERTLREAHMRFQAYFGK